MALRGHVGLRNIKGVFFGRGGGEINVVIFFPFSFPFWGLF